MQTPVTQVILGLSAIALLASLIYCILYIVFRYLENVNQYLALTIGLLIPVVCIFSRKFIGVTYGSYFLDYSPYIASTSLLGAFIHRILSAKPRSVFYCFLLMTLISTSGLSIFAIISQKINMKSLPVINLLSGCGDYIRMLITIQLLATPLLLLIIKNSRLRPGMDKHLDS